METCSFGGYLGISLIIGDGVILHELDVRRVLLEWDVGEGVHGGRSVAESTLRS